jgi:hypothetical protein
MPTTDTIDGYVTKHYRIISEFSITPLATPLTRRLVTEIWTADLPFKVLNPWDLTATEQNLQANLRELHIRQLAVRRQIEGTPIKIVTTMPMGGPLGGLYGPGGTLNTDTTFATTTTTLTVYGFREIDVPDTTFVVPQGFTRQGGPEVGRG